MDCREIEELILTDYTDGKIEGDALKEIESHIASCSRCRFLASEAASASNSLRKAKHIEPPARVWEKIRTAITAEPSWPAFAQDFLLSMRSFFTRLRPGIVAVTAAVIILAVLIVGRFLPPRGMMGPDEIMPLITLGDNDNGSNYDFGTPEESYFL